MSLDAPHIVGRSVPGSYLSGFDVNYRDAIRLGDTVRIEWTRGGKRDDPADGAFGIVRTGFQLLTHEDRAVYDGSFELGVQKRVSARSGPMLPRFTSPARCTVQEFVFDPEEVYDLEGFPVGEGAMTHGRTTSL